MNTDWKNEIREKFVDFGLQWPYITFIENLRTAAYEQGRRDAIGEALEKIKIERSKWLATKNASSASYVSARENGFHQVEKILATISTKEEERI